MQPDAVEAEVDVVVGAAGRGEPDVLGLQVGVGGQGVCYLINGQVEALAVAGQEAAGGRVGAGGLGQLDEGIAAGEGQDGDFEVGEADFKPAGRLDVEHPAPVRDGGVQVVDDDGHLAQLEGAGLVAG